VLVPPQVGTGFKKFNSSGMPVAFLYAILSALDLADRGTVRIVGAVRENVSVGEHPLLSEAPGTPSHSEPIHALSDVGGNG
jgi:hypothetical protein